ncbi:hypothetical protein J3459_010035 [Metarhizium acridum]|nr:hypothetical protein J3459_010035 [Metarhizium acridum]
MVGPSLVNTRGLNNRATSASTGHLYPSGTFLVLFVAWGALMPTDGTRWMVCILPMTCVQFVNFPRSTSTTQELSLAYPPKHMTIISFQRLSRSLRTEAHDAQTT